MARSFRISARDARCLVVAAARFAFGSAAGGQAVAAASGAFLPHQALYELSLLKSRGSNSINSARGRILYNFSGSSCDGYTSEFRQVSELDSGEGKTTLSDLRSSSWEDGAAERTGDGVTVKLKAPVAKTFKLDGKTVFPTEQIQRIVSAARDGKPLL